MTPIDALSRPTSARNLWLGALAYVLPTFPIAYAWHLVAFAPVYGDLAMYRDDAVIPFGLISMLIQGVFFSWIYPQVFPGDGGRTLVRGLVFGLAIGLLSWSFTTLSVAAKNVMTSVPTFLLLETGFTFVQFAVVGPLIALAHRN